MNHWLAKFEDENLWMESEKLQGLSNIKLNNAFTTAPMRIAYFLWTMRGDNELEPLEYYLDYVADKTDNFINLRGAYGPRMRHWIGPDQLQEAIEVNQDVSKPEDFVKPASIDQLKMVFDDLFEKCVPASTIILRDPAIDFDASNDIPDLHSVTFQVTGDTVKCHLYYTTVDTEGHFYNDLWLFQMVAGMYASWLQLQYTQIFVSGPCKAIEPVVIVSESEKFMYSVHGKSYETIFHPDPNRFMVDLEKLCDFEKHVRFRFNGQSFRNNAISVEDLYHSMAEYLANNIEDKLLADMGNALMIFAFSKYAPHIYDIAWAMKMIQSNLSTEFMREEMWEFVNATNQ